MAKKEDFTKQDQNLENVEEVMSTTSVWIEEHKNMLMWIVLAIVVVVGGCIAVNKYVIKPKAIEASNENAKAEVYFTAGDWQKALSGDDAECIGFEAIADEYSRYQEGELAALYAGICHYKLGEYEEAAKYLKKFSAKDLTIDPAARQLLGDAYVQMDELEKAAVAFRSAANSGNEIVAPMSLKKAGFVYLELGDKEQAKKVFEMIREQYPTSAEASDIDKYIALTEE